MYNVKTCEIRGGVFPSDSLIRFTETLPLCCYVNGSVKEINSTLLRFKMRPIGYFETSATMRAVRLFHVPKQRKAQSEKKL
jgi:hypothetical protein